MTDPLSAKRSHWPISILSSLASLFNMLLPLFLVRVLSPQDVGVFKVFFLYLMLTPAPSMTVGLVNGLSYWAGRGERGQRAIQVTSWLVLLHALLSALAVWVLAGTLAEALSWRYEYVLIFALSTFGGVAARYFEEAAICTGRIWIGALFFTGFELVRTFVVMAAAWFYRDLAAVFLVHAAFLTVKAVAGWWYGKRLGVSGFVYDRGVLHAVNRYAFPISVAGVLSIPVNYADQLILSAYAAPPDFAYYAIGCLTIPPLLILEHSITRVVLPQISAAFAQDDGRRAARLYRSSVEQLALILVPSAVGLAVFADAIIGLLFTESYLAAAGYLRVFALNYLMLVFPNDIVPRARGEAGWILKNFTVFSALAVLLCFAFTMEWGAYGALAGILAAKAAMRGYGLLYIRRSSSWPWQEFLPLRAIGRFVAVSLVLGALSLAARPLFAGPLMWLAACGAAFCVLYFVLLLIWKVPVRRRDEVMRIVMVSQYLRIGGLERMVLALSECIQHRGACEVSVFSYDGLELDDRGLIPEFERRGIAIEALQKGGGFSPRIVLALVHRIIREQAVIVHSHDLGALIYAALAKLCCPRRVYLVHTQHSFVHLKKKRRYVLYERLFCRLVDDLIVVSELNRQRYMQLGFRPERITVIENGVELPAEPPSQAQKRAARRALLQALPAEVSTALASFSDQLWVLNLARLSPEKGHVRAIALWQELPEQVRERAILIFVGPLDLRDFVAELRRRLDASPAGARVVLAGPAIAPACWYAACDVYLSCSDYEGLPLGPIEAIGNGLPAVLSEIPGHAFLKGCSRQYPADDVKTGALRLGALMRELLADEPSRGETDKRYARWIRANFSLGRTCGAYEQRYARLTARG